MDWLPIIIIAMSNNSRFTISVDVAATEAYELLMKYMKIATEKISMTFYPI